MRDRALRGDGVFTTLLCVDGTPVHVDLHIDRILNHAKLLGISVPLGAVELKNALREAIEKNTVNKGRHCITITVTGGISARGLKTAEDAEPTIIIRISPAPENTDPVHAVVVQSVRRNEGSPVSQIKSLNYGDNILALREAEAAGVNEAIMINNAGHVTCFTVGNIFILHDKKLFTPPLSDGVMEGIIRRLWIQEGHVEERSMTIENLEKAEAIFLTNSLRGIVPITSLGGKTLPAPDFPFDRHIEVG